jgi:oligopeptide/dipeptide ABC transporter ATP-binding protein
VIDGTLLRLDNVYKHFHLPGNQILWAVNGVSFKLNAGECLAVVGESGCGKSTLARMIARVEPISEGTIYFDKESINLFRGRELRALRRKMQIIFQDPISVFSPRMKIGEFLREPFINYGILSKKGAREKAREILEDVGLSADYLERFPHQLSGGELQRVAITRAMALNPLLLICDEPTSALDVSIQKRIIDLLYNLRLDSGVAMLFISHDLAVVNHFSDRIMVMYLGYVMEEMPSSHLSSVARHPYTKALLQAAFSITKERDKMIVPLSGETPSAINLPPGCPFRQRCTAAKELCSQDIPPLREVGPGHFVACHNA